MSLFDLTAKSLDGKPTSLRAYEGKVVLVVNTASECGYTPQYEGLQALWTEFRDRGLVVLGFPSNDFGEQEPGAADQIQTFCSTLYGVSFPLFEKVHTQGKDQSAVYAFLTRKHDAPKWNFHKYLVGRNGEVIKSFPSKVAPESAELRSAINSALDGKSSRAEADAVAP